MCQPCRAWTHYRVESFFLSCSSVVNSYLWTGLLIAPNVNKAPAFKGLLPSSLFNGHTWLPSRQNTGYLCNPVPPYWIKICLEVAGVLLNLVIEHLKVALGSNCTFMCVCVGGFGLEPPPPIWFHLILLFFSLLYLCLPPRLPLLSSRSFCSAVSLPG